MSVFKTFIWHECLMYGKLNLGYVSTRKSRWLEIVSFWQEILLTYSVETCRAMLFISLELRHFNFEVSLFTLHKKWGFLLRISSVNVIWSHLLKKSLIENLIFCAVSCSRLANNENSMNQRIIWTRKGLPYSPFSYLTYSATEFNRFNRFKVP